MGKKKGTSSGRMLEWGWGEGRHPWHRFFCFLPRICTLVGLTQGPQALPSGEIWLHVLPALPPLGPGGGRGGKWTGRRSPPWVLRGASDEIIAAIHLSGETSPSPTPHKGEPTIYSLRVTQWKVHWTNSGRTGSHAAAPTHSLCDCGHPLVHSATPFSPPYAGYCLALWPSSQGTGEDRLS